MTPTMLSLLAAIREYPDEDTPRLAFADAAIEAAGTVECRLCKGEYDEIRGVYGCKACHGFGRVSDGLAQWGEFVKVQCELAADQEPCNDWCNNGLNTCDECRNRDKLRHRERELWPAVRGRFEGEGTAKLFPVLGINGIVGNAPLVLIRRGFPSVVRCTLAEWMGGECGRCGGEGDISASDETRERTGAYTVACPTCKGTTRTTGIGPRLAQRWPIVEVEVTDAVVIRKSGGNDTYYVGGLGMFPQKYWRQLEGHRTPSASRAALSAVLIAEARGRAEVLATA